MAFPGLRVATAGTPAGAYSVLRAAIQHPDPVLFFEHKGLYARKGEVERGDAAIAEIGRAAVVREGADVTIVATLLMLDRALQAAEALAAEGIDAEVVDLRWLRPLDVPCVTESVRKTGRLVIAEEQVHAGGWGATLLSRLLRDGVPFAATPSVVGLPDDLLVPYSPPLEDAIIPDAERIADAVRALPR
jgi:pyruvate dehydrogenase E1 component beta subunit